ncbi:hypothetical protein [Streptomyces sp. NPDC018055]|uniref:hypothetical protein n=1 Tax=Streptomyces sp. NPDC018055 TaxID=3365038 RepID=UPI00379327FC
MMEIAGVPHELVRWTARRSDQIATCLSEQEHEYVTAVDDDHELRACHWSPSAPAPS